MIDPSHRLLPRGCLFVVLAVAAVSVPARVVLSHPPRRSPRRAKALALDPARAHPNVLLVIADDLNCRLGCYGDPAVRTPNIDRLAARGVRFARAYCQYPVCNASRASFLSGRYPGTTEVVRNDSDPRVALGPDFQFLPEHFRAQGYFTAGIGKIAHSPYAASLHWDVSETFTGPGEDDDEGGKGIRRGRRARAARAETTDVPFLWEARGKEEDYPDWQIARRVTRLLEQRRETPFFIVAGFHLPHVPHAAPAGLEGASFAPLLSDPGAPAKKAAYTLADRHGNLGRAVRTERFTYLEWPDGSSQLYDYEHDPREYVNLAADPQWAATLADMRRRAHNGPPGTRLTLSPGQPGR